MNNRFKFRVWDETRKQLIYPETNNPDINENYFLLNQKGKVFCFDGNMLDDWSENFIIQQFTGLLDKDGNKIFEGDILFINCNKNYTYKVIIKWLDGGLHAFEKINNEYSIEEGYTLNHEIGNTHEFSKIIGNIFENPELLK